MLHNGLAAMSQRDITAAAHLVCDGADRGNSLCGQVVAEAAEETALPFMRK